MRFLPSTRGGVLWRALVGGILVIGFAAGAVATAGLLQVKDIVDILNTTKPLADAGTVLPAPGQPETLLLVGSDHRYGQGKGESNTDTMMLVRIDDSSSTINLLSIPRDLEVQLPGVGASKLNAAWEDGGPKLLIDTLTQQVFPGLQVNHVLNIDFAGFAEMINAIGCVYTMVDQRYYNDNIGTPATNFSDIDIQPGYQKLCGGHGRELGGPRSALAFVRFRHDDSDLVRESRQQDFLRWAKSQFSTSRLLDEKGKLLSIFGHHVSSEKDLHTTSGLLDLFNLAVNANGHVLKSFKFPVDSYPVIGGEDFVQTSIGQSEAAYRQFMKPTPISSSSSSSTSSTTHHHHHHASSGAFELPHGLSKDIGDGRSQAAQLDPISFPVYYPKYIPSDYTYCFTLSANCNEASNPTSAYQDSYPRRYEIADHDGHRYSAYVLTLAQGSGAYTDLGTGEYFNVEGTTWRDPPILSHPTKIATINGHRLYEYYNGGELSLVAWRTSTAVYWVANTLEDDIPAAEMVAMAATFTRAAR